MKPGKLPTKKQRVIVLIILALATFVLEYYRPGQESVITSIVFFSLFIYELYTVKNESNI